MSAMTLFLSMFPHSQVLGQHKFCRVQGELFNLVYLITLQPTFLNTQVTLHSLCVSVHMSQYWPTLNTVLPYRCPSTAPPWTLLPYTCPSTSSTPEHSASLHVFQYCPTLNTAFLYTCPSTAPPWTQHFSCTDVVTVLWSNWAYCVIGPTPCNVSRTFPSTLCLKHTQLLILTCPVVFFSCLLVASYIFFLCSPLLNYTCSHVCVSI